MRHRAVLGLFVGVCCLSLSGLGCTIPTNYRFVDKLVDSSDGDYSYGYGPSILRDEGGRFHMFYCSTGTNGGWDNIRYVWSNDGRLWSAPRTVLSATDLTHERATCDPSVVHFKAPGDSSTYYYLFYSGNAEDVQTVMFVARATSIGGPYAKWTTNRTWQVGATNPQIIIGPKVPKPDGPGWYGAGQQTVVVRDGHLVSWYTDDTTCASPCKRIFMTTATDPTSWAPGTQIDAEGIASVDVKYDAANTRYQMFYIENEHSPNASLARMFSTDGITFKARPAEVLAATDTFPRWTNNVGLSGDMQGHLINGRALIVYGAPYDLNPSYDNDCGVSSPPYCWGYWDLYGSVINPAGTVWNDIPWGWQWAGMTSDHELALGDYDADGKTDRAIIDPVSGQWFVICSGSGNGCNGAIPWGWQWAGMTSDHELALGDYDGDGKTDRAIIDPASGQWFVICSGSGNGCNGAIPWGWQWAGMTSDHELALGDYDGDGKTDRAIIDPASAQWFVICSGSGNGCNGAIPWGWQWAGMTAQHVLALGDYDGDHKTDRAIIDPASGQWFVICSGSGNGCNGAIPWGWQWAGMTAQHALALGDYDGDHKTDRVIVERGSGRWYVLPTTGFHVY